MTREEADFIGGMNMCDEISNEAYKKIMCHCEEQEPCTDAISRQAVHEAIEKWAGSMNVLIALPPREVRPLLDSIHTLPPVTPQLKTGCWNRVTDKTGHLVWECDCGWQQRFATNFCPDCGTKMVESEEQA